ncbi:hypothetical protein MX657_00475 [Enterobacter chuandaensis]|uniref:hypothetical protein n=1 Tax=Enterobacter chuandaensis TaxID=2497875 RepID=UPI0032166D69
MKNQSPRKKAISPVSLPGEKSSGHQQPYRYSDQSNVKVKRQFPAPYLIIATDGTYTSREPSVSAGKELRRKV